MWQIKDRPKYYKGEQKNNMRRSVTPLVSALVAVLLVYLLWAKQGLQDELVINKEDKIILQQELAASEARILELERNLSDAEDLADHKTNELSRQKENIQDQKNKIKSELTECQK